MTAPARAVFTRPRHLLSGATLTLLLALGGTGSATAATGPSQYAGGLHVPAGGIVDPDNRVWVSDHNGGFCRLTAPDDRGPGTIDHPSTPGAPANRARTCLGGLLPDAAPGPDAAGQPAFSDPTPELPGSGDEIALIPDGAAPSMDVWRAHWNPHTKLFEADPATDVILMDADAGQTRPRPTAVTVAPDGDAYVVFQRSSSIQRIVEPDSQAPRVQLVGFTADNVGTSAIAAGYGALGPMGPPTVYVGESSGVRQITGVAGNTTTSPSSFGTGATPALISTLAYQPTDTVAGHGTLYAGTAEAAAPLVLPGPDRVLRLEADADPTVVAGGFSTVGGLAIRSADGTIFAFDDPALAIDAEPLGRGRAFVIGDPHTQILSGPSQPAGQPALDPEFTADSTPTFTYAGEFARQCSTTAATAAANVWQPCNDTSYTAAELTDGRYRFAVRSVNGTRTGRADTRYFSVDTTAPSATPLVLNPKPASTHLRAPRFSFDNDDPAEAEFGYQCKVDDGAYAACDEGLSASPAAAGPHTLQIKLVDAAGNVGTVESAATSYDVGLDPATADSTPTAHGDLTHPGSVAVYGEGLHVSTGALEDPAGRVWVSDHNGGFCRVTDPTLDGAGHIDHPELPGAPRSATRTCLGGLLPDAGPGADAAGPPTFVDPTPKRPGNGDEVVLIADGFAHSNFIVRLRWDPGTELFEYLDQVLVPAVDRAQDRPRPVTTQIGPDPDGIDGPKQPSVFFVSKRDSYIGRVDQPASDAPSVHVAGFVGNGGVRAEVLAVGQRDEVVQAATDTTPAVTEKHPVIYLVSQNGLERLDDPRIEGEPDAADSLSASPAPIAGVLDVAAMAYDLQRDVLYVGEANALATAPGQDRFLRVDPATMDVTGDAVGGFTMIGGIGLRDDGRILVLDDRALLDPTEPLGEGLLYQIGSPAARIAGGPSDPENDNLDPSYTSDTTPSFTLAGDTPRECWVRPAGSATAPAWQACNDATFTTPALGDGAYEISVRATGDPLPANADDTSRFVPQTLRFTVDTQAPGAPSVTSVKPLAADGITNAEPFFTFQGEAGVRYSCRLNATTYNKVPCRPGRTFPKAGTPPVRNGQNTLFIKATDKAGNTSPQSPAFTFQADTTIPVVTIASPEEGRVTGTEARFVFKASQTASTTYGCRLDGAAFKRCDRPSDAGGPGRPYAVENLDDGGVAVTYRGLSTGDHRFQVHASDTHNNVSPNASRNIRVDTTAPVALVDAPAPNSTTGGSTTLQSHIDATTIGAGETNTLACTLMRGGTPLALPECDESIPVSGLQSGVHTFTVQATDSAGNAGPVGTRTWTVDATAPVITIRRQGIVVPTFTITTDEPATLECHYDDRAWQNCATVDGSRLGIGRHTLFVRATDQFGNVSEAQQSFVGTGANTSVPASINQAALRSGGLPVTFTAVEGTTLARFVIARSVPGGATTRAATRAAKAAAPAKTAVYKKVATAKLATPKSGVYRRKLTARAIRTLAPGLYRIETRLRATDGAYGEPAYNMVRVKKAAQEEESVVHTKQAQ